MKDKDGKILEETYNKINENLQYKDHWVGSLEFPEVNKSFKVLATSFIGDNGEIDFKYYTKVNGKEFTTVGLTNGVDKLAEKIKNTFNLGRYYYTTQ